jgi:hypothetical protein
MVPLAKASPKLSCREGASMVFWQGALYVYGARRAA